MRKISKEEKTLRAGCCDTWSMPCGYHKGWLDGHRAIKLEAERIASGAIDTSDSNPTELGQTVIIPLTPQEAAALSEYAVPGRVAHACQEAIEG